MRKTYSPDLEKRALKTICTGSKEGHFLMSKINKDHFATEVGASAYERISVLLNKRGVIITWRNLCEDPSLHEDLRASLRSFEQKPCRNENSATGLFNGLENFRKIRALNDLSRDISTSLQDGSVDVESIIDSTTTNVSKLSTVGASVTINHIGLNDNTRELVRKMLKGEENRFIPTGFNTYDSVNHGILDGSLFMVGAPAGNFKSLMVQTLARNFALQGAKVCIAPLEMNNMSLMQRELSMQTQIPLTKMLNPGKSMSPKERKQTYEAYRTLSRTIRKRGGQLTIFSSEEDLTLESFLSFCKPYGYKVLIVDYVGLLAGSDGDDQVRALGRIARRSKIWASANNAVVVLAAQMSDDGLVRYSRAMNEHASLFWSWKATPQSRESHTIKVHQGKSRMQDPFSFDLYCNPATMLIRDLTAEEIKALGNGSRGATFDGVKNKSDKKGKYDKYSSQKKGGDYDDLI